MISIQHLSKTFYAGRREIRAAVDVSFEVAPGEVYGLLGPNGAGKTTMMRMILGLLKPDEGYAEIAGHRSDRQPDEVKRQVGFVSASAGVYQWLTGREMLGFFGEIYGLSELVVKDRIEELSHILDLADFIEQGCATLSTGQKQRLSLARALIHDPPVMILDEPTLGLDVIGSQVIFNYIDILRERDKSIILCTHRLEQAQRVCNRFGLMHRGRKVLTGSLSDLQKQTGLSDLVEMFIDLIEDANVAPVQQV
ncbi:ATP-binding cassette domain-containing protein [Mariniblastus sp.]|jgi:sodium transport system ATP-binding protein|nr:ATP-binding cassette domain-containing protein [Mariniblastus sp.]MDA7908857.1 ATP-binding cassette domain-containing protein [bacterium]MDA7908867.1 ATP-binding cassette domain-containing protein [bacterium]MDB4372875.1 ATP-binding cassette domain-containing protein [Mariniblastus sp.]